MDKRIRDILVLTLSTLAILFICVLFTLLV